MLSAQADPHSHVPLLYICCKEDCSAGLPCCGIYSREGGCTRCSATICDEHASLENCTSMGAEDKVGSCSRNRWIKTGRF